jgi:hypothetical protein
VTGVVLGATNVNGTKNLTFSATVDETTTGGSNVAGTSGGAQYWIDGSPTGPILPRTKIAILTNGPRVVAATSGSIPAASLPTDEGTHHLFIQGRDVLGQDGTASDTTFVVDKTAPVTQFVTVTPNATNGTSGNPAHPGTVRITADVLDPISGGVNSPLGAVEMYLNPPTTLPATGNISGIQMSLTSGGGSYPAGVASRYIADMPLSWVGGFTNANVTVVVVGLDKAGNRATTAAAAGASSTLLVDHSAPVIASASVNQAANAATATLTVTATDTTPGIIARIEYWTTATDPGVGLGTLITGGSATLDLNALNLVKGETVTYNVRAIDTAGNVSKVTTFQKTFTPVIFFQSGFDNARPDNWTSAGTTGTGATLAFGTPALVGTQSLIVSTTNANNTATATAAYTIPGSLTPQVGTGYSAHFTFAPLAATTGNNAVTIFTGSSGANTVVQVRYQRNGSNVVRVTLCVKNSCVLTPASGVGTLTAAASYTVRLDYTAGGTTTLTVIGGSTVTLSRTVAQSGSVSSETIGSFKIGIVARAAATAVANWKFDTFASARVPF